MKIGCDNDLIRNAEARAAATRAILAITLVVAALSILIFLFAPASVHAASAGRIFGQLVDGTKHNAPVVGEQVTLQMAQGNTSKDLASVTTDAHGAFSFNGLGVDQTISYDIYTRYQGAQYFTDLFDLSTKPIHQVNLTVYEATTSTAKLAIVQANVLLHEPDAQGGVITVSEILIFDNLDTRTYVGSLDASKGKPHALRFSLPPGARNISLASAFNGYHVIQVDRGFATDAAVPPGESQFSFSFEVPYSASTYDFSYVVTYPTVQLAVMVAPDVQATASGLTSEGQITANNHLYNLFQGQTLLTGVEVRVQLSGLPVTKSANSSSLNPASLWLVVGLLILLAILFVTWFIYRSVRRGNLAPTNGTSGIDRIATTSRTPARDQNRNVVTPLVGVRSNKSLVGARPNKPLVGARPNKSLVGARHETPLTDARPHATPPDQQALLQDLLDLDTAFEAGEITKAEYEEQQAKTKAQLRTLMSGTLKPKPAATVNSARKTATGTKARAARSGGKRKS